MIIDFIQNRDNIELSTVTDEGKIINQKLPLKSGFFELVEAEEYEADEENIIQGLRTMKNRKLVKRVPSYRFSNHSKNYFVNNELKLLFPQEHERAMKLNLPNLFTVDIETDITDETGYSTPDKAENKILSISVTDTNCNSVMYVLKTDIMKPFCNPENNLLTDISKYQIKEFLIKHLAQHASRFEYKFDVIFFDSEEVMISTFLQDVNKHYHAIAGHNFYNYDWLYIETRCTVLNIPITISSPTNKLSKKKVGKPKKKLGASGAMEAQEQQYINLPAHRVVIDYMLLFKESLVYNNLESYSLDSLCELKLRLGKVTYSGNLRKLYNEEPVKFLAYAFADTILLMLLHFETKLYDVDFYEAYFNRIAYNDISQNSISESLIYTELTNRNLFLPKSEYNKAAKQKFTGGYVKKPIRKEALATLGLDYSGLYVNCIITMGICPTALVDSVEVNEYGLPKDELNEQIWFRYRDTPGKHYILSPKGNIYDNTEEPLYVTVEKGTLIKRKIFKNYAEQIYLDLQTKIQNRINELKVKEKNV